MDLIARARIPAPTAAMQRDNPAMDSITGAELIWGFFKLERLIAGCYNQVKELSRVRDPRGIIKQGRHQRVINAKEWLAGVELPCIYEEFSGRGLPVGYSAPPEMIDFVKAVMKEFDLRYSVSSIETAIRILREKRRERSRARAGKNAR
jgi:hypothetical protein